MFTKTISTTHHGRIKVSIPENLNEMTVGMLMAISEHQDAPHEKKDLKFLSILSGVPYDQLATVKHPDDIDLFTSKILSLAHQLQYVYDGEQIPKEILFGEKKVRVMKNLSVEPIAAYLAAKDIIADEVNKHIEQFGEEDWKDNIKPSPRACAMLLAHYFYSRATDNQYKEADAEEYIEVVKELPVQVAMPVARYFFLKYPNLYKRRMRLLTRLRQLWNDVQVLRRLKSSKGTTSSTL